MCLLVVIYSIFLVSLSEAQKNGQVSNMLWNLVLTEQKAGKVIGAIDGLFPTSAKFFNGDLSVTLDKDLLKDPGTEIVKDIKVFNGKGIEINPTNYPIAITVDPPNRKENICGLIIGSSYANNDIKKVQILWKPKPQSPWDLLAVPSTGEYFFGFSEEIKKDERVLLFDPVPASSIRIIIYAKNNVGLNLTAALIYGCQYKENINLSCNEILDQNNKFRNIKEGVPVSISCPKNCVKTKSCIGYKVYSSDGPICSEAEQALSNNGDGNFFLYKISSVAIFRDQVNPVLNNGIYCKRSSIIHSGITFNRVYYDFSVKEYQKLKG